VHDHLGRNEPLGNLLIGVVPGGFDRFRIRIIPRLAVRAAIP
jgi:hypothetical protein